MHKAVSFFLVFGIFIGVVADASAATRRRKRHRHAQTASPATGPFSDVPLGHWSYDAVSRLAESGVISYCGWGRRGWHRKMIVNRYQMAVVTVRMLDRAGVLYANGRIISSQDVATMEALSIEFEADFKLLNVKPESVETLLRNWRRALALQQAERPRSFKPVLARLGEHVRQGEALPLAAPAALPSSAQAKPTKLSPFTPRTPVSAIRATVTTTSPSAPCPPFATVVLTFAVTGAVGSMVRPRPLINGILP